MKKFVTSIATVVALVFISFTAFAQDTPGCPVHHLHITPIGNKPSTVTLNINIKDTTGVQIVNQQPAADPAPARRTYYDPKPRVEKPEVSESGNSSSDAGLIIAVVVLGIVTVVALAFVLGNNNSKKGNANNNSNDNGSVNILEAMASARTACTFRDGNRSIRFEAPTNHTVSLLVAHTAPVMPVVATPAAPVV